MKMKSVTGCVLVLLGVAAASLAEGSKDADFGKLIVGKWKATVNTPAVKGEGLTEYKADGTFAASGKMTTQGMTVVVSAEGVWSLKGAILTWTVKKTGNPELMAVGETHKDVILEIDADRMTYKNEQGETEVETRVKEEPAKPEGKKEAVAPQAAPPDAKAPPPSK